MARKVSTVRNFKVVAMASVAALGLMPTLACAQAAPVTEVNVSSQDLGSALTQAGRQTKTEIIFSPSVVKGKTAPAVRGQLSAEEAISRLIAGSGLKARRTDNGAFVIERDLGNAVAAAEAASSGEDAGSSSENGDQAGISEILVVGSRSQNVDIRRTENDPRPYVVFDSEEIERSQASNAEEFLRHRLPMNAQVGSAAQSVTGSGGAGSNISAINLRGLGPEQTLILVDGRRAPRVQGSPSNANSSGFIPTQADINGIPIAAIDRIEVLPASAGAIYGGGAVGGVINIIRKRDYQGLDTRIGHDGSVHGGGEAFHVEISGGFSPNHGRTQISFSGAHSKSKPLRAGDNNLWKKARQLYTAYDSGPVPGYQTNIAAAGTLDLACALATLDFVACTQYLTNLTLDAAYGGQSLGSPFVSVPDGFPGITAANAVQLVANAGQFNLNLSDDGVGRRAMLLNEIEVNSGNLNIRHEISNWLNFYLDLSAAKNVARSTFLPAASSQNLSANDPNNPFQQNIIVMIPRVGIEKEQFNKSTNYGLTVGLIAKISRNWGVSFEYSRAKAKVSSGNSFDGKASALSTAARSNPAFNPILDVNRFPTNYTSIFLNDEPDLFFGPATTTESIASARLAGTMVKLPGGDLTMTALLEWRKADVAEMATRSPITMTIYPKRAQSAQSAYLEINAPVFSRTNNIPLFDTLEIQGALRYDHYVTRISDVSRYVLPGPIPSVDWSNSKLGHVDYTLALKWGPVRDLFMRASYSTGYLPPNVHQLTPIITTVATLGFRDPQRGNTFIPVPYVNTSGGNLGLEPEKSKSISVGLVIAPSFLPGLRLSADFSSIRKRSEIIGLNPSTLLANEGEFPGRVTRNPDPASFGSFNVGPITELDVSFINANRTKITAWDFQGSYKLKTASLGEFNFYTVATRQNEFRRQLLPSAPLLDLTGYVGGPLKWRGNVGVDWTFHNLIVGWNAQYYHSYSVRQGSNPTSTTSNVAVAQQGSERIPHQIYHDIMASYQISAHNHYLDGLQIMLGVQNIFDKHPPALSVPTALGTYSQYGDPRLRRYMLSLKKHFGF